MLKQVQHDTRKVKFTICILHFTVSLLLLAAASASEKSSWNWIDADRVGDMLKEGSGLWLIDVRSEAAYRAEHIEGSVNIPAASLRYKKFPQNKMLVLVDDSLGQKIAREAAEGLAENGYEKLYILGGGIVSWEIEGYPIVKNKSLVSGVTAEELKWALSNGIPLKMFDMRDIREREKGRIQNSAFVNGKDIRERIKRLNDLLKKEEGNDLANRLRKPRTIILVFSASDDAGRYIREILQNTKSDIRYLIGGYETFIEDKKAKIAGNCPTCPGKGR